MSFSEDIAKWADKAKLGYDEVATASMLAISTSIITMTPVDTGRARGNWLPNKGTPKDGTTNNTKVDFDKVEQTIKESIGDVFYLTNNLPYIKALEFEGHSDQAPAGMVRVSIENFQKNLVDATSKLDN